MLRDFLTATVEHSASQEIRMRPTLEANRSQATHRHDFVPFVPFVVEILFKELTTKGTNYTKIAQYTHPRLVKMSAD